MRLGRETAAGDEGWSHSHQDSDGMRLDRERAWRKSSAYVPRREVTSSSGCYLFPIYLISPWILFSDPSYFQLILLSSCFQLYPVFPNICIFFCLVAQTVKNPPAVWETWVRSLGWEGLLEKGMATHSSILTWRIPWSEEPGGLQSMGLQRVGDNWVTRHTCLKGLFKFFKDLKKRNQRIPSSPSPRQGFVFILYDSLS